MTAQTMPATMPATAGIDELLEERGEQIAHAIAVALDEGLTDPTQITLATALVVFPVGPGGRGLTWPPPRGATRQRAVWERLGLIVRLAMSTPREGPSEESAE